MLPAFDSLAAVSIPNRPVHLAVGMFDGVHLGHVSVLSLARSGAKASNGLLGVLSFFPHPSRLFRPDQPALMLMSPEVKTRFLIERQHVDFVVHEPFTPEFAAIEAENFLRHLSERIPHLAAVYVGESWRFGRGRRGDVSLLERTGAALRIKVFPVSHLNFGSTRISSTRIRDLLKSGDLAAANELLGYSYFADGTVVSGQQLGAQIGFPTLNIPWAPDCRPAYGVYRVCVSALDGSLKRNGVANYGVRPTVAKNAEPQIEAHIFEDCPWTAGAQLRVEFLEFLRGEKKFPNLDALRTQIAADVAAARSRFTQ